MGVRAGVGNGDVVKFPHGSSGRDGLVAPPSPRSLSVDSDRPRQRRSRSSSSGRGGGLLRWLLLLVRRWRLLTAGRRASVVRPRRTLLRLDDRIPLHYRMTLALAILRPRRIRTQFEKPRRTCRTRGALVAVITCTNWILRSRAYIGCPCRGRRRRPSPSSWIHWRVRWRVRL